MKMCRGLTIFGLMGLLSLAAPLYAYQYIGAGASSNCQPCHAKYTSGTDWHTAHVASANNDCAKCHDEKMQVLTKNCSACHANTQAGTVPKSGADGCGWVSSHKAAGNETCLTCHTTCTTPDQGCPASACLGSADPRIDTLRKFRDDVLAKSPAGKSIIKIYYASGEVVAKYLDAHPAVKSSVTKMIESFAASVEPLVK